MGHDRPPPPDGNPYLTVPAPAAPERAACGRWLTVAAFGQTLAGSAVAAAGLAGPTRPLLWAGECLAIGAAVLAVGGLVAVLAFAAVAVPGAVSAVPLTLVARRRFPVATGRGWR
jgi:hypothetical protein